MTGASYVSYGAFALVCICLLTLPFVPALREWLYPTDITALPISSSYTNDIDHFARRLRADAEARLGWGEPTGYEDFDFVSDPYVDTDWGAARRRLIARSDLRTASPIRCKPPLYVMGSVRSGTNSTFSALYATGDIDLGAESEVHDWAHADGTLRLRSQGVALRRISAGKTVRLGEETWFERVHAPEVHFGSSIHRQPEIDASAQVEASYADVPLAVRQTDALYLVRGNCTLAPGSVYRGSLVVTGFLIVGRDTTVMGDIKAREGISIGRGASVQGAITCEKRIYLFEAARAWGPVVSESDILVGTRASVGLPQAHTTVTARNIIVEDGALVHGTVWAHDIGMVKSA